MTDLLGDTKRVYAFHVNNEVRTSHEMCVIAKLIARFTGKVYMRVFYDVLHVSTVLFIRTGDIYTCPAVL